jgi:hypothetical protein
MLVQAERHRSLCREVLPQVINEIALGSIGDLAVRCTSFRQARPGRVANPPEYKP